MPSSLRLRINSHSNSPYALKTEANGVTTNRAQTWIYAVAAAMQDRLWTINPTRT